MAECPEVRGPEGPSSSANYNTSNLLIPIEDLVNCRSVEKQRLEFKKSWNEGPAMYQIIKTISAFANDIYNNNGGYIVIGVAEDESSESVEQIVLPPVGIDPNQIERIQKEILGKCKSLISPQYSPILSPEVLEDKYVLVVWAQASDDRPHKARGAKKGEYHYYIRKGPETTKANDKEIKCLLESSNKIPFDDRMARPENGESINQDAIGYRLVMAFLDDVGSKMERSKDRRILENLNLVVKCRDEEVNGRLKPVYTPKNVALLMFNRIPHKYFPGASIEVTQFTRDNEVIFGGEKMFTGPLQDQIKECMKYVYSTTNKMKSASLVTYPHQALREAIVNAVYHRGYEPEYSSSTKVYIRPHCLEVISYPGPHPSLKQDEFTKGSVIPPVQARNRRIGDFLRQLNLAEARGTGVETIFRTMEKNKNPTPKFQFDLTYFRVILPAHPKFKAAMLLKDVEVKEASGNRLEASEILQKAFDEDPKIISQHLMQKLIVLLDGNCDHPNLKKYEACIEAATKERCILLKELKSWLTDKKKARENITTGVLLVEKLVKVDADADDLLGLTDFVCELYNERTVDDRKLILESNQTAHQLLEAYGQSLLSQHGVLAFHFACIKYQIYIIKTHRKNKRSIVRKRNAALVKYLTDARDLLQDAVKMSSGQENPKLFAEQQRQLGYVLSHLHNIGRARKTDCEECFSEARKADPKIVIKKYF